MAPYDHVAHNSSLRRDCSNHYLKQFSSHDTSGSKIVLCDLILMVPQDQRTLGIGCFSKRISNSTARPRTLWCIQLGAVGHLLAIKWRSQLASIRNVFYGPGVLIHVLTRATFSFQGI
ncbi:hypothetical protein AMTRI_Chr10g2790 [Amborella trichopoda]